MEKIAQDKEYYINVLNKLPHIADKERFCALDCEHISYNNCLFFDKISLWVFCVSKVSY